MDIVDSWRHKYRIHLETERFVLRPLSAGDADWLAELLADSEVSRFLWEGPVEPVKARTAAQAIVDLDAMRCHFGHWAIEDKVSRLVHGWVELSKLRPWRGPSDEIALSYVLRRPSWGRGIATEAAGRLLRYAFDVHGLDRVMAVIMAENKASRRVLEKLGLRFIEYASSYDGKPLQYFRIDSD